MDRESGEVSHSSNARSWQRLHLFALGKTFSRLGFTVAEFWARPRSAAVQTAKFDQVFQQGLAIPVAERPTNATLVEWIRHCRRSSLYEQGRLLFDKGGLNLDTLSEEQQVEVEEDYRICVRRVQASIKEKKPKTLFDEI